MTVEELQNFIADNVHANVDDKVVGQIMSDAANMDFNSFTNKWDEFLQEHSAGWSSAKPNDKDIYTRLREAYGSSDEKNPFAVPENFSDEIYEEKFKDVPKDEYNSRLAKMKELWDVETKERKAQVGKTRRKREIEKDWNFLKKMLANEYSQARYVDDPNSTPFGKEGKFDPWDNKLELANIGLQGASLVGDALPGVYGYAGGPGVRLVNDLVQEAGEYGKPAEDILKDRAIDVGTSFIGEAGPNALLRSIGRSEKLGRKLGRGINETMGYADLLKEVKETNSAVAKWKAEPSYQRRQQILKNMPDNYVKRQLEIVDSPTLSMDQLKKIKPYELEIMDANTAALLAENDRIDASLDGQIPDDNPWLQKVGETPQPGAFGKKVAEWSLSPVAKGAVNLIARDLGKVGSKSIYDKQPESDSSRKTIEWYKKNYARDWDMGFKPKENAGLLYQAWKEYKGIE
ncbi:MAG: hypothetical protein IIZ78_28615 [Clostridiales bacterium]|nr:hypothetical protein [Clostridiales bacterium]